MLTWRGEDTDRLEQVRLVVSGARLKAYGRIIAAATAAFTLIWLAAAGCFLFARRTRS